MGKNNCITVLLVQLIISGAKQVVATEETQYVRDGEDVTLSCSGLMNVTANWYYKQYGQQTSIPVAIDSETSDPNKYSALYNQNNGIYDLTVHDFIATSDAGRYTCRLILSNTLQKEVIITTVVSEGPTTASITGNTPVFADGSTSQLTLTCTATAIPAVMFEWRNRGDITGGGTSTLTLSPVQTSDNGANITCTAINSEYNDIRASHSVILAVYYGPDSVVVTGDSSVYADGINTLTFTCDAVSVNPGVSFQWSKDGTSIGDNSDALKFTPVQADDGQEIACTATNTQHPDGQARGTVILTVYYGPSNVFIDGNKPVYANATTRLTLTCTATQYSPGVGFQWREGNMNITGENKDIYTKIAVKSDNGKSITCIVWNSLYPNGKKETSIQLSVYYACKATVWVSETNPSEGDDVTVVCTCDSNPAGTFAIKRPTGEPIHQSRLNIENIVRRDTGEYVCTVGNVYGNQTKSIDILVNYAPEITVTLPATTTAGDRVEILCEADGIPNSYNFGKWRQLGPTDYKEIQILHGTHSGNQSLLTFDKPLTYEDSGFYECNVNNGVFDKGGVLDQSVKKYLEVVGAPTMLENKNLTYGKIGQDVKVEVSFYSVPQFTIVTWLLASANGHQNIVDISLDIQQFVEQRTLSTTFHGVSVNVNGYVATLLFKNMTVENIGTYVAVIYNDKGLASYTNKLEISLRVVTEQNLMNTKENVDSPAIGVVAGSATGASILVVIIVIVVVVLCKRGVITKPKSACLKGNASSTKNVYMNQAFSPVTGESGHADETEYQEIGPSVNPRMHYEYLTRSDTPTENIINQ